MRRNVGLMAVLVLVWQALAWVSPYQVAMQSEAIAHAVVHGQELDHHHHTDRSLHLQDDAHEPAHQHANEGAQPAGLVPAGSIATLTGLPAVLVCVPQPGHVGVYPDGLLRPPQRTLAAG